MRRSVVQFVCAFAILFTIFLQFFTRRAVARSVSSYSQTKYNQAMQAKKEGDFAQATDLLKEAVKNSPGFAKAHIELGRLYFKSKNVILFDRAPIEFLTVIELSDDPTEILAVDARYYLGIIFLKMGDYDKAIASFFKVLDINIDYPRAAEIYNYLGVAFYHKDMYQDSIRHFKKSIQLNPPEEKVVKFNLKSVYKRMEHYNLGMTYYFMKDYDAAITEMLIAIEVDSNYFDALYRLGDIYLAKGMPGEALRSFQRALRVNPNHRDVPQVYNGLGVSLYKKGQAMKAVKMLRKALTLRSTYAQAKRNLRNIFGSIPQSKLLKVSPSQNKEKYVAAAAELAKDYVLIGLYDKGIKLYEEVLQLDFDAVGVFDRLVAAYREQGDNYFEKEDYKFAVKTYKRLTALQGETPPVNFKLGVSYYHQGKYWYNDAIEAFTKAINLVGARYYLGLIYFNRHEYLEATFHLEEALKNNEEDSDSHFLLAKVYNAQGRTFFAIDEIKRAIEIDPQNNDYQDFLVKLSSGASSFESQEEFSNLPTLQEGVNPLDNPATLNNKGVRYAKNNMLDRAGANFRAGLEKDPGSVELRNNNALLMILNENLEEAEKELLTAALLNPMEARILINIAILYHMKKMYTLSREHLAKARKAEKKLSSVYDVLEVPGADISNIPLIWMTIKQ